MVPDNAKDSKFLLRDGSFFKLRASQFQVLMMVARNR